MHPMSANTCRDRSHTSLTIGSTGYRPRLRLQATRTPLKSRCREPRNIQPGSSIAIGACASGSAITESSHPPARTERPIGPSTLIEVHGCDFGHEGTRPIEGRKPTTPQKLGGFLNDPPWSVPSASGVIPQATDTAAPPLLPPQVRVRS